MTMTATPPRPASNLLDVAEGIPPALADVVARARDRDQADRELVAAILAAKRPAGPHTIEQVLEALAAAGVTISRATLYNWLNKGSTL